MKNIVFALLLISLSACTTAPVYEHTLADGTVITSTFEE